MACTPQNHDATLVAGPGSLVQEGLEDALPVLRHEVHLHQRHPQVRAHRPRVLHNCDNTCSNEYSIQQSMR
jgi:hypothetical protein